MLKKIRRLRDIARFMYAQRIVGFDVSDTPWLDEETAQWLEARLAKTAMYMEFGAGGSTRLAGRMKVPTISVEGDRYFARSVRRGLAADHQVTVLDAGIGTTVEWAIPLPGKPNDQRAARWANYVNAPFTALAAQQRPFPDLVLVDGRFRRACALKTALEAGQHAASAELLFDDYFDTGREHYHVVEEILGAPQRIGRSAIFSIRPVNPATQAHVDAAIRDYR
ncbi:hypothetical protein [Novosphingobium sp. AAP83]|uniref:hypothetical protein n=1 Tax=Novosphingobium sp. AAP83 TaxID=1523425 RepID=UPI0006B94FC1|nr:hypothetical protein [Novosphingobium sp. AAP83]